MNLVDAYIEQFNGDIKARLEILRAVVKEIAPDAEETISYAMPTYKLRGKNMVYFAGYAHHIGLYPTPDTITAFEREVSGLVHAKGSVQFSIDMPLPVELIRKMIQHRADTMGSF